MGGVHFELLGGVDQVVNVAFRFEVDLQVVAVEFSDSVGGFGLVPFDYHFYCVAAFPSKGLHYFPREGDL